MEILESNLLGRFVELGGHCDMALRAGKVIEQLQRLAPPHGQRDEDPREHDRGLERQHREVRRHDALEVHRGDLAHSNTVFPRGAELMSIAASGGRPELPWAEYGPAIAACLPVRVVAERPVDLLL